MNNNTRGVLRWRCGQQYHLTARRVLGFTVGLRLPGAEISMHALPVSAWASSGSSSFLQRFKDMQIWSTGYSKNEKKKKKNCLSC